MLFIYIQVAPLFLHVSDIMPPLYNTCLIEEFKQKGKQIDYIAHWWIVFVYWMFKSIFLGCEEIERGYLMWKF